MKTKIMYRNSKVVGSPLVGDVSATGGSACGTTEDLPAPARSATCPHRCAKCCGRVHSIAGGSLREALQTDGRAQARPLHLRLFGFTLLEVIIASALFGLVVAGTISVYIMCNKIWHTTALNMQTVRDSNLAMARLVYGVGTNNGLRTATTPFTISSNANGWNMTCPNPFDGNSWINYDRPASNIYWSNSIASQMICDHVYSAGVSTNRFGLNITLTVYRADGQFISTNQISTFIKRRN